MSMPLAGTAAGSLHRPARNRPSTAGLPLPPMEPVSEAHDHQNRVTGMAAFREVMPYEMDADAEHDGAPG